MCRASTLGRLPVQRGGGRDYLGSFIERLRAPCRGVTLAPESLVTGAS